MVTGRITILNGKGDTIVKWDVANQQATEVAERKFNELAGTGHLMTETRDGKIEQVRSFNPEAHEITAIPQLRGG